MDYFDPHSPLFLLKIAETVTDIGGILLLIGSEPPIWWITMAIGGQLLLRLVTLVQHALARPSKCGDVVALIGGAALSFAIAVQMLVLPCHQKYPNLCALPVQIVASFLTTLLLSVDLVLTLTAKRTNLPPQLN